ncbi:hypothetical protein EDC38_0382 [Marinimicrobium koreense]|uniref:DUF4810 domain-containing protein n=1 Tax=Marinimicrobium koreense TaxID=306545 RepID=A0A3N1NIZ7_9GAMM|nr:DUF4810 domain-containing protein [Marinimicrobium koreense]ROQ19794.1 hypothetical protein EDC38_0382 [Marinimicrobium koreense]
MNRKLLFAVGVLGLLSACVAPQTMYDWGQYEQTLFVHYHEPALKKEALADYIAFVEQGGRPDHPLAPGLYAEAGTFLLEEGDLSGAMRFYQMEYDAWPESRPMLGTLIENLEARIDE